MKISDHLIVIRKPPVQPIRPFVQNEASFSEILAQCMAMPPKAINGGFRKAITGKSKSD
ncbi:hypothetical protein [Paenibacillus sp. Leaf72]|uniref:hypothetical protein n=1 Tax=Paenibacillus sp. Leaf72 TaxID=1736234 RepID=UPI000A5A6E43|nr:hypothetical protein [Paenibacillus sp. Leaf72]